MNDTINQITVEIADMLSRVLGTDAMLASGYSTVKARAIAQYALLTGEAYAAGDLDEAAFQEEMRELDRMAERFVRNIRALAHTSIERAFQVVSEILRRVAGVSALSQGIAPPELSLSTA